MDILKIFKRDKKMSPSKADIKEFYRLLELFNNAQKKAVSKLTELWSMKQPMTTKLWVSWSQHEYNKHEFKNECGITIFPHGFGLSYQAPEFIIDFDFGKDGEIDGFDSSRLWFFIEQNDLESDLVNEYQIKKIIIDQTAIKHLYYSGYINYYKITSYNPKI